MAPSITEILFAIGLKEELSASRQFCDYPPAARRSPKSGYTHPNIEVIVTLQSGFGTGPARFSPG